MVTHSEHIHVSPIANQFLLFVGIVGALMVGISEWLIHFVADGSVDRLSDLQYVPLERVQHGHNIAIVFAPLYFAGYYGVMRMFSSSSYWFSRVILVIGIYAFAICGMWLCSKYLFAEVLQDVQLESRLDYYLEFYATYYQSILWIVRMAIVMISLIFVGLIWNNKVGIPRWVAFFNPALLSLLIYSMQFWIPTLGSHLVYGALHIAHVIFFSILLDQYRKVSEIHL